MGWEVGGGGWGRGRGGGMAHAWGNGMPYTNTCVCSVCAGIPVHALTLAPNFCACSSSQTLTCSLVLPFSSYCTFPLASLLSTTTCTSMCNNKPTSWAFLETGMGRQAELCPWLGHAVPCASHACGSCFLVAHMLALAKMRKPSLLFSVPTLPSPSLHSGV